MAPMTRLMKLLVGIVALALVCRVALFFMRPAERQVPYPVRMVFLDKNGALATVEGDGNIYREGGPYMKCVIWSDGQRSWESDPNWINQTNGRADVTLRGNERPEAAGKLGM